VLYICLPSHNVAATVGLLLWRIRKVCSEYSREYEVLVYDDASTDETRATLEPYAKVMPLTVLGAAKRVGYAAAVDTLLRAANSRTRYPRRDAVVLMQADFTDPPDILPDVVKRFEGGADLIVCEVAPDAMAPEEAAKRTRLLRRLTRLWPFRNFVAIPGIGDPFGSFRLIRLAIVRDVVQARGDGYAAALDTPVPVANAELTREVLQYARRVETVQLAATWDLRPRPSRISAWREAIELVKRSWAKRGQWPPRAQHGAQRARAS
jgi:glycosyltransferase involved in cell wall biosynthesis